MSDSPKPTYGSDIENSRRDASKFLSEIEQDIALTEQTIFRLEAVLKEFTARRLRVINILKQLTDIQADFESLGLGNVAVGSVGKLAESKEPSPKDHPLWRRIARLMEGRSSFRMPEAWEAVEAETGKSVGPNRSQTIRNSLTRHPETFRRNHNGTWTVISNEKEAPEETS